MTDKNDENGKAFFTCKECGSNNIEVVHSWETITHYRESVPCGCEVPNRYAYQRIYRKTLESYRCGWLSDYHCVEDWDRPDSIDGDTEDDQKDTLCEKCLDDALYDQSLTETEELENRRLPGTDTWEVRCGGCRRELEFGWESPDLGGRIFPVECDDFDPDKLYPEPRYEEAWKERGWWSTNSIENGPEADDNANKGSDSMHAAGSKQERG